MAENGAIIGPSKGCCSGTVETLWELGGKRRGRGAGMAEGVLMWCVCACECVVVLKKSCVCGRVAFARYKAATRRLPAAVP